MKTKTWNTRDIRSMRNVGQWLTIHVDILRHPRTKIGVEYVHALKMVDRWRERIVSLSPYLKTPPAVEYSVHEASFVLATSSFAAAFSRENFERIPTLLTNLLIPLSWLAMRFFHFHELAAVSPGFPPS